jgi:hypothetical protein
VSVVDVILLSLQDLKYGGVGCNPLVYSSHPRPRTWIPNSRVPSPRPASPFRSSTWGP